MTTHSNYILHISTRQAWGEAQQSGEYRAPSLETEGFIHCSSSGQILAVANRFYRGQTGLVLLWIDPEKVKAEIRWEAADGEEFPHIYGPLNLDAVLDARDFPPGPDGFFL
jgi:uncharacterized protein (DUF952 family)